MEDFLQTQAAEAARRHSRARRYLVLMAALSLAAAAAVGWRLHQTGISATEDFFCGTEEHIHSEACYTRELVCGLEEGAPAHIHGETCYEVQPVLVCTQQAHAHEDACYAEEKILACALDEHIHTADCFDEAGELRCTLAEHTHADGCYEVRKQLVCGVEEHTHGEGCYEAQSVPVCGQEEAPHQHDENCYAQVLTCALTEHTHGPSCLSDETADVESEAERQANAGDPATGNWSTDLLGVARAQLGYRESTRNFEVSEDGIRRGYTRYGADYGDPYGSWEGMFLAYCLRYSGVPESVAPRSAGVQSMLAQLSGSPWLRQGSAEAAQGGDIVFFGQTAGIVAQGGQSLQVICGNVDGAAALQSVDASSVTAWLAVGEAYSAYALPEKEPSEEIQEEAEQEIQADAEDAEGMENSAAVPQDDTVDVTGMMDLSDMITVSSFQYDAGNGQWLPVTDGTVEDGTKVLLTTIYHLKPDPTKPPKAYYTIPEGFHRIGSTNGDIVVDGEVMATYEVKDGKILFTYTEALWNSSIVFQGTIYLEGTVDRSALDGKDTIVFPGNASLTVKPKPTSASIGKKILSKTAGEDGNVLLTYQVTLSSETGMGDEPISFLDKINTNGGSAMGILGYYKEDSFSLIRNYSERDDKGNVVSKKESVSLTDGKLTFSNNTCPKTTADPMPTFTISDLTPLKAGESYVLAYTVIVPPESFDNGQNGEGKVFNYIEASYDSGKKASKADKVSFYPRIVKNGSYDPVTGRITWKIRVYNPFSPNGRMTGALLTDTLPENLSIVGDVQIREQDETGAVLDQVSGTDFLRNGYTFPDGLKIAAYYVFVFETEVPPEEGDLSFTNRASITNHGVTFPAESNTVTIPQGTWGISKQALSVQNGIANWSLSALNANGASEFEVLDQILDASDDADGELQTDSHYAIAAELMHAISQNLRLTLTDRSVLGYADAKDMLTVRFYESADGTGEEVPPEDQSTHVHSFRVKFSSETAIVRSLLLTDYPTHAEDTAIPMGDTWTYANRAAIGSVYSQDAVSQTNYRSLDKRVSTDGGKTYSGSSTLEALPEDGMLDYEIELRLDAQATAPITLTDQVPYWDSADADTPSFVAAYVAGSAELTVDGVPGGTVTAVQDQAALTFTLSDFGTDAKVLLLHYRLDFSGDQRWKDLTYFSWDYSNRISWGERTDSVSVRVDRRSESLIKQAIPSTQGSNRIEYRVFINLNQKRYGHALILRDTMNYPSDVSVTLERSSVGLYYYKVDSDGNPLFTSPVPEELYAPVDPKEGEQCLLKLQVPDGTAMILRYFCDVSIAGYTEKTITNTVFLEGSTIQSGTVPVSFSGSMFDITYGQLIVDKTDSVSGKLLPDTIFGIYRYDASGKTWTEIFTEKTDANGRFTVSVTPTQSPDKFSLQPDTLYCLTEKDAPEGYILDSAPHYLIFFDEKTGASGAFARAVGDDTEIVGITDGERITEQQVSFCAANKALATNIQNAPQQLFLEKIWLDIDNRKTDAPEGVTLTVAVWRKGDGEDTFVKNVILSEDNGWKLNLGEDPELPLVTAEGDPIRYYVVEMNQNGKPLDPTWEVSYSNDDGIQTGTIYIYNRIYSYELPKTGGTGTGKLVAAGICLMALAAAGMAWRKERR